MTFSRALTVFLSLVVCVLGGLALRQPVAFGEETPAAAAAGPADDYVKEVKPILAAHCYECHGAQKQKGGIRLDSKFHTFQGGDRGESPIKPGDAKTSHLMQLVRGDDPELYMPPKGKTRLTAQEIGTLTKWIDAGATWPDTAPAELSKPSHWSFIKPVRPEPPQVSDKAWCRNAIDQFVLARLDKEGLRPSPEADKYALIRRVSLDLVGLPPTPQEVDAFVNDSSPDAYEKLVDRLLASPHYGERMARIWLDLARYADSAGYGSDPLRMTSWHYRDWVINAFNRNEPYDQFTIDQLAGDLLPNPTQEQLIATGFHRNTQTNTEGGTDDEEWRVAAVKDRTSTTAQVWMGLTMQCAECHTHKYDPITNREYYQFAAFFNQTEDNDQPDESPTIPIPTKEQQQTMDQLNGEIAKAKAVIDDPVAIAREQAKWELAGLPEVEWQTLKPATYTAKSGADFTAEPDGSLLVSGKQEDTDTYTVNVPTDLTGITAFRIEALPDPSLPANGPGRAQDGNFALNNLRVTLAPKDGKPPHAKFVRVELPGKRRTLHLAEVQVFSGTENVALKGEAKQSSTAYGAPAKYAIDGNTDGNFNAKSVSHTGEERDPWWEVELPEAKDVDKVVLWSRTDSNLQARLNGMKVLVLNEFRDVIWEQTLEKAPDKSIELDLVKPQPVQLTGATETFFQKDGDWSAAKAIDRDRGEKSGWAIAPRFGMTHSAVFQTSSDVGREGGGVLTFTLSSTYPKHGLGRFRISATTAPRPVRIVPQDVANALALAFDKRSDEQKKVVTDYFKTISPLVKKQQERVASLEEELKKVNPSRQAIMRELPEGKRRKSTILVKGNFLNKGAEVQAGVPSAFNPFPKDAPNNRLGLAKWIVDPENPLTARVAVNRWWAAIFGTGIVQTQEDWGTQGQPPSHPELLDWLATEYLRTGWDTKAILKTIVTSATYRQSSRLTPELVAKDPYNRLFAHGPRARLEAELVRDQALGLSGLLSNKMLGPSVYPPQPPNLWQAAFNGERNYPTSTGEDKYRRGIYTFWRRTVPYPSMQAFDAPSRETCTVRRISTSTPLQAFVTLNDPVYIECAQALGRRIVKEGGKTPEERIAFALKLCLERPANPEQVKALVALYQDSLNQYQSDKKAADSMATDPIGALPQGADASEMAAWTVVSNVLLNLDGVLTKG